MFQKRRLVCCLIPRRLPRDARKGRREDENRPFVPCASSLVTRVSRSPPLCDKQGVLDTTTAKATKTSIKKWICVRSISITITPTHLLCPIQANSFWAEFLRTTFKNRKRKKIQPSLVYVLHTTWNKAFSSHSRAVTAKKKRDGREEVLFCLWFDLYIAIYIHCHIYTLPSSCIRLSITCCHRDFASVSY